MSTSFETKLAEPKGSKFRVLFIQCSSCGGVVGVQDVKNVSYLLIQLNKAIVAIAKKLGVIVKLEE